MFTGNRRDEELTAFVQNHLAAPSEEITCDKLDENLKVAPFSVVYFGEKSGDLYEAHEGFAKTERDDHDLIIPFEADKSCASKFKVDTPGVMMYRRDYNGENQTLVFNGTQKLSFLSRWIKTHMVPGLFEFSF